MNDHKNKITINNIVEIDNYISKCDPNKTILFFDIDNTLLRTCTDIFSDEWVKWQEKIFHETNGKHPHLVSDDRYGIYYVYQNWLATSDCETELLEDEIEKLVSKYSSMGFKIILITARHKTMYNATLKQLQRHYDINHFYGQDIIFQDSKYLYQSGIFFAGGDNKAKCIKLLLDFLSTNSKFSPDTVCLVDDSLREINNSINEFSNSGTNLFAFHYVYCKKYQELFESLDKNILHQKWLEINNN